MFVGHEFLAFALVGWGASRLGADSPAALRLGAVAGLAALLPDLDVLYAVATYAVAVTAGTPLGWEAFWGVANGVHRVVTHPLPVGVAAALVFGVGAAVGSRRASSRAVSLPLATLLYALAAILYVSFLVYLLWTTAGTAAAVVASAFLAVVGAVGGVAGRQIRLPAVVLAVAAGVGFLTHPFGDVFLAAPPPLLSPFGPPVLTERVALAADPTLEIFGVLFVELAAVWLGVLVALDLGVAEAHRSSSATVRRGVLGQLRATIDRYAGVGVAYAVTAPILPRPTVVDAHVLGFTIVPLAAVVGLSAAVRHRSRITRWEQAEESEPTRQPRAHSALFGLVTGLATLTLAAVAYVSTYALTTAGVLPLALG
ncbi:metal-dependent hydrolase [Halobellus salinisoli]|uniref:metal-dependent hydrolase n=1 Tax=Halobellus salinisoli TaxID=3108500 RepID=UPI00300AAA9E